MSMRHGHHRPTGVAPDLSLSGMLIGFPLLISAVIILFSSVWTAVFILAYAVGAFILAAAASDKNRLANIGVTLIMVSTLVAAIAIGFGVFTFHWISLTLAGWIVTGLYAAGLAFGVFAALSAGLRLLALLMGAALAAALVLLPVPASSFGAGDQTHTWSVELTVLDADGEPVDGALAACAVFMQWNTGARPGFDAGVAFTTDENGEAAFTFNEDPRLKLVSCAARVSYARMSSEYANQAYYGQDVPNHDPAFAAAMAPAIGNTAHVTIRLREDVPSDPPDPFAPL